LQCDELFLFVINILQCDELLSHVINILQCDELLSHDGDFLVRESPSTRGQFVLSGRHSGHVRHLLLVDPEGKVLTPLFIFCFIDLHYYSIVVSLFQLSKNKIIIITQLA